MSEVGFPEALPQVLTEFLAGHPDARLVIVREPSFARIEPQDAHPSLAHFEPAPELLDFAIESFTAGVQTLRRARRDGLSHQVLTLNGGQSVHLSVVGLIGTPFLVLVAHPTAGMGPLDEQADPERYAAIYGTCDLRLGISSIQADPEVLPDGTYVKRPLIRLFRGSSTTDVLDCWLRASSDGASSTDVQIRNSEEVYTLSMLNLRTHVAFSLVERGSEGGASEDLHRRMQMREIADAVPQGFFRVSERGELLFKNQKLDELFGRRFETLEDFGNLTTTQGSTLTRVVPKLLANASECVVDVTSVVDGDERIVRLHVQLAPTEEGDGFQYIGSAEDVTDVIARESELEEYALTDPLTGTANRRSLELILENLLSVENYEPFALLLCDLDGFKQVNDSLGHGAGDEVIAEVGRRLTEVSRQGDTVARLGGDEFVVIATRVDNYDEAMEFAERILPRLRKPFHVAETQIELSGSVGVALSAEGGTVHSMLQMADHAMYEAKRAGRNQASPYHSPDDSFQISPLALRRDLRRAISGNSLDLAFQPIYSIDDLDQAVSAEALLRWDHPIQGRVEPSTMISIAEQSGLIRDLGEWIITESIRSAASVNAELPAEGRKISIAVNVSALQMGRPDFVDMVTASLDFHQLEPELLTIELTESFLIDRMEKARSTIEQITDLGVRLAVDDFGTGYSTFQYLLSLPVSAVKIDPSFTKRLTEARGAAMLRGLSWGCRELGMSVVAEGIETLEQLEAAKAAGVTHAQGYLLGMPVSTSSLGMRANSEANRVA